MVLGKCCIFVQKLNNTTMKRSKKITKDKETKAPDTEVKKSKIRLYWEDRERRGIPPGIILNMRAVLK